MMYSSLHPCLELDTARITCSTCWSSGLHAFLPGLQTAHHFPAMFLQSLLSRQIPNDWSGLPGVVGTAVNNCPLKCCIAACLNLLNAYLAVLDADLAVLVADLAVLGADLAVLDADLAVCLSGRKMKLPVQLSQSPNPHATLSAASWMMTGCLVVRKMKM